MYSPQQALQYGGMILKRKSILIVGLEPSLIDFWPPELAAFSGSTDNKVLVGIAIAEEVLQLLL